MEIQNDPNYQNLAQAKQPSTLSLNANSEKRLKIAARITVLLSHSYDPAWTTEHKAAVLEDWVNCLEDMAYEDIDRACTKWLQSPESWDESTGRAHRPAIGKIRQLAKPPMKQIWEYERDIAEGRRS